MSKILWWVAIIGLIAGIAGNELQSIRLKDIASQLSACEEANQKGE